MLSIHMLHPGGPRVRDLPRDPVKPTQLQPTRHSLWRSIVAQDPNNHVWTIASTFPRRNPTFVFSNEPSFMGSPGTRASSTAPMLGVTPLPWNPEQGAKQPPAGMNVPPPAKVRKNRRQGFSWNIGSLSTFKFDILRQRMHSQQHDILFLQDTRRGFSGDWSDPTFAYIHSGSQGKAGGLLLIVCQLERISWRSFLDACSM